MNKQLNREELKAATIMAAEAAKAKALEEERAEEARRVKLAEEAAAKFAATRVAILTRATRYGAQSARGEMSLTKLAFLFNEAVRSGAMVEGDAEGVYRAYAEGRNAAIAAGAVTIDGVSYPVKADTVALSGDDFTVPVSTFKTFGRAAVVAQGLGLFQDVMRIQADIPSDARAVKSPYNAMVRVGRRIAKDCDASPLTDAQVAAGEFKVDDAYIAAILTKEAKAATPKSFADKLKRLVTDAAKLVKAGECDDLRTVFDALVIVEANYTLAQEKLAKAGKTAPLAGIIKPEEIGATKH